MINVIATVIKWIVILVGSGYLLFLLCMLTIMVTGEDWEDFKRWKKGE